jgi:hypothetical protein
MSNKQQTAVEFYLDNIFNIIGDDIINKLTHEQLHQISDLSKQAKEMEKEQIKDAYYNGTTDEIRTKEELLFEAEHFYKETYGGNK